MSYEVIKWNYDHKLWNEKMVALAVKKKAISESQYAEITGKEYSETGE